MTTARMPAATPAVMTGKADAAPSSLASPGSAESVGSGSSSCESEVLEGESAGVDCEEERGGGVSVPEESLDSVGVLDGVGEGKESDPEGDPGVGDGSGD